MKDKIENEAKKEDEADPSRPDNLANWSRCIIVSILFQSIFECS